MLQEDLAVAVTCNAKWSHTVLNLDLVKLPSVVHLQLLLIASYTPINKICFPNFMITLDSRL